MIHHKPKIRHIEGVMWKLAKNLSELKLREAVAVSFIGLFLGGNALAADDICSSGNCDISDPVSSGETLTVSSSGIVSDVVVDGGTLELRSNGTAHDTVINSGYLNQSGGTADSSTLHSGTYSQTGGSSNDTDVRGGTYQISGGSSNGASVSDGSMYVSSSASASGTHVSSGSLNQSGGTVTGASVTGGNYNQTSGTSSGTSVSGGAASLYGGNASGVNMSSGSYSMSGGSLNTLNASGGSLYLTRGNASNVHLSRDAALHVVMNTSAPLTLSASDYTMADGSVVNMSISANAASNLVINNGGTLEVNSGTSADNTYLQNGTLTQNDGTTANSVLEAEAKMYVKGGTASAITANAGLLELSGGDISDITMHEASALGVLLGGGKDFTLSGARHIAADGTVRNMVVSDQKAENLIFDNGGYMHLGTDASAKNTLIKEGDVYIEGGVIDKTQMVDPGANLYIQSGSATDIELQDGHVTHTGGDSSHIVQTGGIYELDGGNAEDLRATAGTVKLSEGNAKEFHLSDLAALDVTLDASKPLETSNLDFKKADGTLHKMLISENVADNLLINNGGRLEARAGTTAKNTLLLDGNAVITGGTAEGTVIDNTAGKMEVINSGQAKNTLVKQGELIIAQDSSAEDVEIREARAALNGLVQKVLIDGETAVVTSEDSAGISDIVLNRGSLTLTNSVANDVVVNRQGELHAASTSVVDGLIANAGSNIILDRDITLQGDITIDKEAILANGDFNFAEFFKNYGNGTFTVVHGFNPGLGDQMSNEGANGVLALKDGEYLIADNNINGANAVKGWDRMEILNSGTEPPTLAKLGGDLTLGTDYAKNILYISNNSVLDASGNSPLNAIITGSLDNNGTLDLAHSDTAKETDDTLKITGNYTGGEGSQIKVNVDTDNSLADRLTIDGDLSGSSTVVVDANIKDLMKDRVGIITAANDDEATPVKFSVARVAGSALRWETDKEDDTWYLQYMRSPDGKFVTYSEVMAYAALPDMSFEQTRSVVRNIRNDTVFKPVPRQHTRLWLAPVREAVTKENLNEFDGDITGFEAGLDLYTCRNLGLGAFASYRSGSYTTSGKGKNLIALEKADVDIDSYLAGLYGWYSKNNFWTMATLFGGKQDSEIKGSDLGKVDGAATQMGVSLDVGYEYDITRNWVLGPGAGITYNRLKFDDIKDNGGLRTAKFDTASRTELEAGLKLERFWQSRNTDASVFIRPAIVQTISSGNYMNIAELNKIETQENETFFRAELGANIRLNRNLDLNASIAQSFGGDYDNTALNIALGLSF